MNRYLISALIAVVIVIGLAAYVAKAGPFAPAQDNGSRAGLTASASPSADESEVMMKHKEEQTTMAMTKDAGAAFIDYTNESDAQKLVSEHGKDVVYFFAASWCPDCQALQAKLNNSNDLARLGKNTVIIKADYDKETALKQKYHITHQTAFVRIDANGKSVKQAILSGDYNDVLEF